jgi:hypothetical protein
MIPFTIRSLNPRLFRYNVLSFGYCIHVMQIGGSWKIACGDLPTAANRKVCKPDRRAKFITRFTVRMATFLLGPQNSKSDSQ